MACTGAMEGAGALLMAAVLGVSQVLPAGMTAGLPGRSVSMRVLADSREWLMDVKDWMLLYADGEVGPVLRAAPTLDRAAAQAPVARLYPAHRVAADDGTLFEQADPPADSVYAGCFPGLAVVCTAEAALERPFELDRRFLDEAAGRTVYLHAMHSGVSWFTYAIWDGRGPYAAR